MTDIEYTCLYIGARSGYVFVVCFLGPSDEEILPFSVGFYIGACVIFMNTQPLFAENPLKESVLHSRI